MKNTAFSDMTPLSLVDKITFFMRQLPPSSGQKILLQ
jgi:hypothetical protein